MRIYMVAIRYGHTQNDFLCMPACAHKLAGSQDPSWVCLFPDTERWTSNDLPKGGETGRITIYSMPL